MPEHDDRESGGVATQSAGEEGEHREAPFATIAEALDDLREGRFVIVCDDEDRENEGDLTLAAQFATAEKVNFMAKEGRGLICLALTPQRCAELNLPPMVSHNTARLQTAFTVSIEARDGVTTGISAADRAHTIQVAIDRDATPEDLVQPGHVFPLMARPGGVLERTGQTEAGVDLARLAGLMPAGVICEIMNDDGTMARMPRPRAVRAPPRPQDRDGGRPHQVPPPQREAGAARRRPSRCRPGTGISRRSATSRSSTARTTWRS